MLVPIVRRDPRTGRTTRASNLAVYVRPDGTATLFVHRGGDLYDWAPIPWDSAGGVGGQGLQGEAGPQGPQGIQGPPGADGAQGPQGIQGIQGAKGDTGDPGPQGEQGLQGNAGAQGAQGAAGSNGAAGAQGPAGPAPSGTGFVKVTDGVLDVPSAEIAQSDVTGLVAALAAKAATSSLAATATSTDAANLTGTLAAARIADGSLSAAKISGLAATATSTDAANLTGTLAAARIASGSLALSKLANTSAATIIGSTAAGSPAELTAAQAKTILAITAADVANIGSSAWAYARCTADRTTTGQALADITDLSLSLLANSTYEFEAILMVASSSTAGNQYGVQYSGAGATVEAQISGTLAAATSRSDRIAALNTATAAYVTSGAAGGIRIQGIVVVGANAGNLTIRHLKVTSGTSTVRAQSYMRAIKIA